jgi:hypothetical protein
MQVMLADPHGPDGMLLHMGIISYIAGANEQDLVGSYGSSPAKTRVATKSARAKAAAHTAKRSSFMVELHRQAKQDARSTFAEYKHEPRRCTTRSRQRMFFR